MKVKTRNVEFKEIEIQDGYYRVGEEVYAIQGENSVTCLILGDNYTSIGSSINEYDKLCEAIQITKAEFDAQLEKSFEIIRKKLNKAILEVAE